MSSRRTTTRLALASLLALLVSATACERKVKLSIKVRTEDAGAPLHNGSLRAPPAPVPTATAAR